MRATKRSVSLSSGEAALRCGKGSSKFATGFIAIMSAIVIASILLAVTATGSLVGFIGRSNLLDAELKMRSAAAADACADEVLLKIGSDPAYTGAFAVRANRLDRCQAVVTLQGSTSQVRIQATSSKAVTNEALVIDSQTHAVISWEEIPVY